MYVKVIQLREMGMRRRPRDVDADAGTYGRLAAAIVEHHPLMQLYEWGSPGASLPNLLFPLYEPKIRSFSERGMIVSGVQRASMSSSEPAPTCVQEWSIRFLAEEAPPAGPSPYGTWNKN